LLVSLNWSCANAGPIFADHQMKMRHRHRVNTDPATAGLERPYAWCGLCKCYPVTATADDPEDHQEDFRIKARENMSDGWPF